MVSIREGISRSYPAVPNSVRLARCEVAALAARLGLRRQRLDAVRLALPEAVTNAAVHAYPDAEGKIDVTAAVASDELWVLVSDSGCGHQTPPRKSGLGFGLALIAEACDDFVITERAEGGTEAHMGFVLGNQHRDAG